MAGSHRVDIESSVRLGQGERHELEDSAGEDGLDGRGHGKTDEPSSGTRGGRAGQQCRTGVVKRAADAHEGAECALVPGGRAGRQQLANGGCIDA